MIFMKYMHQRFRVFPQNPSFSSHEDICVVHHPSEVSPSAADDADLDGDIFSSLGESTTGSKLDEFCLIGR